jgi:hypothetical protein
MHARPNEVIVVRRDERTPEVGGIATWPPRSKHGQAFLPRPAGLGHARLPIRTEPVQCELLAGEDIY